MFLPGRKVVCVGLIIFWATVDNLLVATLVKILKETFNKNIGLYCLITFASFFFGNKIIVPKLRLFKDKVPSWNSINIAIRSSFNKSQKT
jgi:hypothetical protein